MELTEHRCSRCGAELIQQGNTRWKCRYCGSTYDDTTAVKNSQKMRELFDEAKREIVNNLRRNLYDATNAEYISSMDVKTACLELKKYLPDDFSANFYEIAVGNQLRKITSAIRNIDVNAHVEEVDTIIRFLIKSIQPEFLLELNNLVERAYKTRDLKKFEQYTTEISEEAERVQRGIYETKMPREVFVAYSSKDMHHVSELVEILEEQGLKCFVAARNLRHGKGAVENYHQALEEAMDHCRSFVFVSTPNSRAFSCDALQIELPYIQKQDMLNMPPEYRNHYAAIPHRYKKPRVEYRVEASRDNNAADEIVKEFFDGYEWVLSPTEVAVRIMKQLVRTGSDPTQAPPPKQKYCANCGAALPESQKFCSECGKNEFVRDVGAFIKRINEQNAIAPHTEEEKQHKEQKRKETAESRHLIEKEEEKNRLLDQQEEKSKQPEQNEEIPPPITLKKHSSKGLCYALIDGKQEYEVYTETDNNKDLVIAATHNGLPVTKIGYDAFQNAQKLRSVIIPQGITVIGKNAFGNCSNLTSVTIPDSVTTIDENAFECCRGLTSIIIPDSVTTISKNAFRGCSNLTSVTIPNSITTIGNWVFSGCLNLKSVTIPDSVTKIGAGAFSHSGLTSITLPNSITEIEGFAFEDCKGLTSITLPESITSIGSSMFSSCSNLTSITIPKNVTWIGSKAFSSCSKLTDITIPHQVTRIGEEAFSFCSGLISMAIWDNDSSFYEIEKNAFLGCSKLLITFQGTKDRWKQIYKKNFFSKDSFDVRYANRYMRF